MPFIQLAKETFIVILNSAFGRYLTDPLNKDQIIYENNVFVCKDLYFNIQKLNDLLQEQNIPFAFCLLHISKLSISWNFEIVLSDVQIITQLIYRGSAKKCDSLLNTMITSFYSYAHMAANCAEETDQEDILLDFNKTTSSSTNFNGEDQDLKRSYRFFEKLAEAAQKIDPNASNIIDQSSVDKLASFINKTLVRSSLVIKDLSLRVECPLGLQNLNRAVGLQLNISVLSLTNTKPSPDNHISGHDSSAFSNLDESSSKPHSGGLWSWIPSWPKYQSNNSISENRGSFHSSFFLPEVEKTLQISELNFKWDLWNTDKRFTKETTHLVKTEDHSDSEYYENEQVENSMSSESFLVPGLSRENIIASSCVFSMPGQKHWIYITTHSLRNGLMDEKRSIENFQVRADFDIGPIICCLSPSQLYWITLAVSQISSFLDSYLQHKSSESSISSDIAKRKRNRLHSGSKFDQIDLENVNDSSEKNMNLFKSCLSNVGITSQYCSTSLENTCYFESEEEENELGFSSPMSLSYASGLNRLTQSIYIQQSLSPLVLTGNLQFISLILLTDDEKSLNAFSQDIRLNEIGRDETPQRNYTPDDEPFIPKSVLEEPDVESTTNKVTSHFSITDNHKIKIPSGFLPTPYLLFNRINGKLKRKHLNSNGEIVDIKEPFQVDTNLVNTGKVSGATWISDLRMELSLMLYGRDHIMFCGGLWRIEPEISNQNYCLNADLQFMELSECLYPEPYDRTNDSSQFPNFIKLITFENFNSPDIHNDYFCGKAALTLRIIYSNLSIANYTKRLQNIRVKCQLSPCQLEIDVSLGDRIKRLEDAIASALEIKTHLTNLEFPGAYDNVKVTDSWLSQAVRAQSWDPDSSIINNFDDESLDDDQTSSSQLSMVGPPSTINWNDSASNAAFSAVPNSILVNSYYRPPVDSYDETCTQIDEETFPVSQLHRKTTNKQNSHKSLLDNLVFIATCPIMSITYRFPIPFYAIKMPTTNYANTFSDDSHLNRRYHEELLLRQTALFGSSDLGHAWWRRTLRPESLLIKIEDFSVTLNPQQFQDKNEIALNSKNNNVFLELSFKTLSTYLCQPGKADQHFLEISDPDIISSISIQRSNTRIEGQCDMKEEDQVKLCSTDLTSAINTNAFNPHSLPNFESTDNESALNIPMQQKRTYLADEPESNFHQYTYYPNNSHQMDIYRSRAKKNSQLLITLNLQNFNVMISDENIVSILYLRLVYDATLWESVLPTDRRSRKNLQRPHETLLVDSLLQSSFTTTTKDGVLYSANSKPRFSSEDFVGDHRNWVLNEPARPSQIYGHPLAAREASIREAQGFNSINLDVGIEEESCVQDVELENKPIKTRLFGLNDDVIHFLQSNEQLDSIPQFIKPFKPPSIAFVQIKVENVEIRILNSALATNNTAQTNQEQKPSSNHSWPHIIRLNFLLKHVDFSFENGYEANPGFNYIALEAKLFDATVTTVYLYSNDLVCPSFVVNASSGSWPHFGTSGSTVGLGRHSNSSSTSSLHRISSIPSTNDSGLVDWPIVTILPSSVAGAFISNENVSNCLSVAIESKQSGANKYGSVYIRSHHKELVKKAICSAVPKTNRKRTSQLRFLYTDLKDDMVIALRISDLSYIHWPVLDLVHTSRTASLEKEPFCQPIWFHILSQQLTNKVDLCNEYPTYRTTVSKIIQNIHFERVGVIWGAQATLEHSVKVSSQQSAHATTTSCAVGQSQLSTNKNSIWLNSHPLNDLRVLILFDSICICHNSATTLDYNSDRYENVGSALMAFIDNSAMFLCPKPNSNIAQPFIHSPSRHSNRQMSLGRSVPIINQKPVHIEEVGSAHSANGFYSVQSGSPNLEPHHSVSSLSKRSLNALQQSVIHGAMPIALKSTRSWLQQLDVTSSQSEVICLADLDHLELRCFVDEEFLKEKLKTKIDLRLTDNKLRIHSCADSLSALTHMVQSLFPFIPQPNDWGFPLYAPEHETNLVLDLKSNEKQADNLCPRLLRKSSKKMNQLVENNGGTLFVEDPQKVICVDTTSNIASPGTLVCSSICSSASTMSPNHVDDPEIDSQHNSCSQSGSDDGEPKNDQRVNLQQFLPMGSIEDLLFDAVTFEEASDVNSVIDEFEEFNCSRQRYATSDSLQSTSTPTKYDNFAESPCDSDEFVLIDMTSAPKLSESIRCIHKPVDPDRQSGKRSWRLEENFFEKPVPKTSVSTTQPTSKTQLFLDPKTFGRASFSITVYDSDLEWTIYSGRDLPSAKSFKDNPFNFCAQNQSGENSSPDLGGHSARSVAPKSVSSHSPKRTSCSSTLFNMDDVPQTTPNSGARPEVLNLLGIGGKFKRDRAIVTTGNILPPPGTTIKFGTCQNLEQPVASAVNKPFSSPGTRSNWLARGGPLRDHHMKISLQMKKIYYRQSFFEPGEGFSTTKNSNSEQHVDLSIGGIPGEPVKRYEFRLGTLKIVDEVHNSNANHLLYPYSSSCIHYNPRSPLARITMVSSRVLPGLMPQANHKSEASNCKRIFVSGLQIDAKLSVQPIRVNLDQNTLEFFHDFQKIFEDSTEEFTKISEAANNLISSNIQSQQLFSESLKSTLQPILSTNDTIPIWANSSRQSSSEEDSDNAISEKRGTPLSPEQYNSIFIRKLVIEPAIHIKFDFLGRLTEGSLKGLLMLFLQLKDAELVIPSRIYQRGYANIFELVEDINEDLVRLLKSQIPSMLITSFGPMPEISRFIHGCWDLISHPVYSICYPLDSRNAESRMILQGGFVQGIRTGAHSFSTNTIWAALELTTLGFRGFQAIAETAYDIVSPGAALRSRLPRMHQPADIREGFGNAYTILKHGLRIVRQDLRQAITSGNPQGSSNSTVNDPYDKGTIGTFGEVLRQVPPTIVAPVVTGCEVATSVLRGFRNQIKPEARLEDEQNWKSNF